MDISFQTSKYSEYMMYALFDKIHKQFIGYAAELSTDLKKTTLYIELDEKYNNIQEWRWQGSYDTGGMVPMQTSLPPEQLENRESRLYTLEDLKVKDPALKFKYIDGLGDFVAWLLHSKGVGWLTHWITGKKYPCHQCNSRRKALNVLIPLPIWKWYFKSAQARYESLWNEYQNIEIYFKD